MTIPSALRRVIANPLPATFLRGGTSKGIFLHRSLLPSSPSQWTPIFLGIMGSPDPQYTRQLDGMGGGISSLSKICVVSEPSPELKHEHGVQVEYTFVQVGVKDETIDLSGNCGNLSCVVGAFALDEGICTNVHHKEGITTIRSFNTNTKKIIDTTFPIIQTPDGSIISDLTRPETNIAGVSGKASQIIMEFINPAGSRTGKLLPTGSPINTVPIMIGSQRHLIPVSLVDATNPTVFIDLAQISAILPSVASYTISSNRDEHTTHVESVLESIRQQGAQLMGLDPHAQAQPKIALVDRPSFIQDVDIVVYALSMGVLHKAVPMTVGLCLAVAASVQGTLVSEIVNKRQGDPSLVRIKHPTGIVDVGAEIGSDGHVKSAKVVRTGRKLMKGVVWW